MNGAPAAHLPEQTEKEAVRWQPAEEFHTLIDWVREHSIPLTILTEYPVRAVERALLKAFLDVPNASPVGVGSGAATHTDGGRRSGASSLHILGNHIASRDGSGRVIEYPYTDSECDRCSNCFRNHMVTLSGDQDCIVFIGAEERHECPASHADIIFATGPLETRCREANLSFHTYSSFTDVCRRLTPLAGRRHHHHPRQAESRRRALWISG